MKVKDIMTKKVMAVYSTTAVFDVANLLFNYGFNGVPVIDKQHRVVGIITEYDFLTRQEHLHIPSYVKLLNRFEVAKDERGVIQREINKISELKAKDIMTAPVVTVGLETPIVRVADIFAEQHINPLPVTDKSGKLIGIVSRADIVKLFKSDWQVAKK